METEVILNALNNLRDDHRTGMAMLGGKVDRAIEAIAGHELRDAVQFSNVDARLRPLEAVHRTVKWLIAALVTAILGGAADAVLNHASKAVK